MFGQMQGKGGEVLWRCQNNWMCRLSRFIFFTLFLLQCNYINLYVSTDTEYYKYTMLQE